MKTIKHLSFILAIAGMGFLLQSCGKDKDCNNKDTVIDYTVDGSYRKTIPYSGLETLTFVRTNIGDTHTFVANGWKEYWANTSTQQDCPQKERYQKQELTFISTSFAEPIILSIYRDPENRSTYLQIDFQKTQFFGTPPNPTGHFALDSVSIQNKMYHDITFLSDVNIATPITYNCYYNIEYGILKVIFENGEIWELLKTT